MFMFSFVELRLKMSSSHTRGASILKKRQIFFFTSWTLGFVPNLGTVAQIFCLQFWAKLSRLFVLSSKIIVHLNKEGERSFESEERSQESLWSEQLGGWLVKVKVNVKVKVDVEVKVKVKGLSSLKKEARKVFDQSNWVVSWLFGWCCWPNIEN